jgi:hypothetical protein
MKYYGKIRNVILSTELPLWKYCLLTYSIFVFISTLVNLIINVFAFLLKINNGPEDFKLKMTLLEEIVVIGLITPLLETMIIVIILHILNSIEKIKKYSILITSCSIALVHSKADWTGFFIIFLMFYLFSIFYITRSKISFSNGYVAAYVPHAVNNTMISIVEYYSFSL